MPNFHRIESCRICGNTALIPILSLGEQALTGVFPRTLDQNVTRGPLELVKCHGSLGCCGLVQLHHSYSRAEMYGDNYGYRSSINALMVRHLRDKVKGLSALIPLSNSDLVLDIGSNDGTTLSFYPKHVTRVGMDPTATKFRQFYEPGVRVIDDFFSAARFEKEFGNRKAKIITSIAMFYDLDDPLQFVEQVADILDDQGVWHLEQSYLPSMLAKTAYDTICHEHAEYYRLAQIEWMTRRCGLEIIGVELNDVNGGSFAVTVAKAASRIQGNGRSVAAVMDEEKKLSMDSLAPFASFAERVSSHRRELRSLLMRLRHEGSTVFGYGASTKGNVILQYCDITPQLLPFIAEVNEDKFGCFTPGTGIPIISETRAHQMSPDYLLVMPWHFRENLIQRERLFLRRGGRMIFPLPAIEVVEAAAV